MRYFLEFERNHISLRGCVYKQNGRRSQFRIRRRIIIAWAADTRRYAWN